MVSVGAIAVDQLTRDRDQLWAEAYVRAAAGERHWLDAAMYEAAETVNEAHTQTDESLHIAVAAWLATPRTGTFTVNDVLNLALGLPVDRHSRSIQTQVGITLRKLGYHGEGRIRVYRHKT